MAWEHDIPRDAPDGQLALVIVLDTGDDMHELRQKELGEVDPSIKWAGPALDGPDVWESYD